MNIGSTPRNDSIRAPLHPGYRTPSSSTSASPSSSSSASVANKNSGTITFASAPDPTQAARYAQSPARPRSSRRTTVRAGSNYNFKANSSPSMTAEGVAVGGFYAPLGRSDMSGSQAGQTSPKYGGASYGQGHSSYQGGFAAPASDLPSNELDLSLGWTSRNPHAQDTISSPQLQQQQQQQSSSSRQTRHAQTGRGATSTMSQAVSPVSANDPVNKRTKRSGSNRDGMDRATFAAMHNSAPSSHSGGRSRPTSSVYGMEGGAMEEGDYRDEGEEDDADELGGGPSFSNHQGALLQRSVNQPLTAPPGGGFWESVEGRETQAARKQNSACDACRNRKVRCNRNPGEEKCAHCKAKGIDCTTIFVQMATTGAKRPAKRSRHSAERTLDSQISPTQAEMGATSLIKYLLLRDATYPNLVLGLSYSPGVAEISRMRTPSSAESQLVNATARSEFVSDLIETYFSIVHIRYPIIDPQRFREQFHNPSPGNGGPPSDALIAVILAWGAKFSENPIIVADRQEAAGELTPTQKKKREAAAPAVTAARIATAHPIKPGSKNKDTDPSPNKRTGRVIGRSRIAEDLVVKAQEVLDRNKVHRIASLDNIRAALIVEALFWRASIDSEGGNDELHTQESRPKRRGLYVANGVWVTCAITHLKEMRLHQEDTIERIADPTQRVQVSMCWFLACMMDAHMSAFYRRKPYIAQEDYTAPLPGAAPKADQQGPHPLASDEPYQIWRNSCDDQVEMMRMVYSALWTPRAMTDGLSARKLEKLASMALAWRLRHLELTGAPVKSSGWPAHWNFADAVTACSTDMNYHIVWILMWEAIEEFGIAELRSTDLDYYTLARARHGEAVGALTNADMELDQSKIRGLSQRIYEEALAGSLRTASLCQVLCDNKYLRLEAGIMKWTMSECGYCLIKFRRPEVRSIVDALRQYGQAFEECYTQANELEQMANEYLHNSPGGVNTSIYSGENIASHHTPSSDVRPYNTNDGMSLRSQVAAAHQQQNSYDYSSQNANSNHRGVNGGFSSASYGAEGPYHQQQIHQHPSHHPSGSMGGHVSMAGLQAQQSNSSGGSSFY